MVVRISLILSILNLVLAAPIVVQEIHEARANDGEVVAPDDVAAMPKKLGGLEAASDPGRGRHGDGTLRTILPPVFV